ncbi:hypothetical protein ABZP36_031430 [Zizania latifolia]
MLRLLSGFEEEGAHAAAPLRIQDAQLGALHRRARGAARRRVHHPRPWEAHRLLRRTGLQPPLPRGRGPYQTPAPAARPSRRRHARQSPLRRRRDPLRRPRPSRGRCRPPDLRYRPPDPRRRCRADHLRRGPRRPPHHRHRPPRSVAITRRQPTRAQAAARLRPCRATRLSPRWLGKKLAWRRRPRRHRCRWISSARRRPPRAPPPASACSGRLTAALRALLSYSGRSLHGGVDSHTGSRGFASQVARLAGKEIKAPEALYDGTGNYTNALFLPAAKANVMDKVESEVRDVVKASKKIPLFYKYMKDSSVLKEASERALGEQVCDGRLLLLYVINGHYATVGAISALLSGVLIVPMVLTHHSIGRNKLEQLVKQGACPSGRSTRLTRS